MILIKYDLNGKSYKTFTNGRNDFICTIRALNNLGATITCKVGGCNDFHNQDKISFAVEALKIAQDYVQQYVNNFDDMNDCLCAIDNQIKRLTHQHEDKGE